MASQEGSLGVVLVEFVACLTRTDCDTGLRGFGFALLEARNASGPSGGSVGLEQILTIVFRVGNSSSADAQVQSLGVSSSTEPFEPLIRPVVRTHAYRYRLEQALTAQDVLEMACGVTLTAANSYFVAAWIVKADLVEQCSYHLPVVKRSTV